MPGNFQFGYEHYLLIATAQVGSSGPYVRPQAFNCRPTDSPLPTPAVHFNNAHWEVYDNVRDVTESGNANSVNITTRGEARRGYSTEVDVTVTGQLTFPVRYKANWSSGGDSVFQALMYAARKRLEIALVDLDGPITQVGAQGNVGNYTITYTLEKNVEGVVIANVTAKLSSYPDRIELTDDSPLTFVAL